MCTHICSDSGISKNGKNFVHTLICIGENGAVKWCTKTVSYRHSLQPNFTLSVSESEKTEDSKNHGFPRNEASIVPEISL